MKFNVFFRFVWSLNALIILAAGSLSLALLALSAYSLIRQYTSQTQVSNVVVSEPPQNNAVSTKSLIGNFSKIEGIEIVKAPIYLSQEFQYRYGSKEASSIQNYIFYDSVQKSFSLLRSTNQGLILSTIPLPEIDRNPDSNAKVLPIADLYVIIENDTNNDQRITEIDQKSLAIADASGKRFKMLLANMDDFKGASGIKDNRVSVFYTLANQLKVSEVDLRSQEIISTTTMEAKR